METVGRGDPSAAFAAIPIGHTERFSKTVSEVDVYAFAGVTGDFSPIHVDEEFCKGTRFGTRIAHGAYGYSTEFPVERLNRDAQVHSIREGTSQVQRFLISRQLLK